MFHATIVLLLAIAQGASAEGEASASHPVIATSSSAIGGAGHGYAGLTVKRIRREGEPGEVESSSIRITRVTKGSPADRAGIREGSTVVSINGASIGTVREYKAAMDALHPGDMVSMRLRARDGEEADFTFGVTARPTKSGSSLPTSSASAAKDTPSPEKHEAPVGAVVGPSRSDDLWLALESSKHRIGFDLGIGSIIGVAGVTYAFSPIPMGLIEVGLGIGFSGIQVSIMPMVTMGSVDDRFIAGIGYSMGWRTNNACTFSADAGGNICSYPGPTHFMTVDFGYEHRGISGNGWHIAAGPWIAIAGPNDFAPGGTVTAAAQIRIGWSHWILQ